MPDKDQKTTPIGESERSFKPEQADGRQADLFSRNDREGIPAEPSSKPDELAEDPSVLEAGEAGGYQADAFSRGDEEGVPQEDLTNPQVGPKSVSRPQAAPDDTRNKARDDADSRDARPMPPREGGVR